MKPGTTDINRITREEFGRSVATLVRAFGDIDLAEEAVQEAFAAAAPDRHARGLPPYPGGWITTTERNRAIDRIRREARGRELLRDVATLKPAEKPRSPSRRREL